VSKSRIKAMSQPFWSQYRLRVDEFRVYYDVDENHHIVNELRVLRKTTDQTPEVSP
jgi:mRNA-degrading endonuclease RelE of RelBE toxin-antitoxin system